jgi:hypothetical protein
VVGIPRRKRTLEKPRRKQVDNIKIDIKEIVYEGVDWIHVTWDGEQWVPFFFWNAITNLRIP